MAEETAASRDMPDSTWLRAVVFDCGGVLTLPPTAADWEILASTVGLRLPTFMHRYWEFRDRYDCAVVDALTYWRLVAATNGREVSEGAVSKLITLDNQQWTRENTAAVETACRLRTAGIKTAVLSNMEFEMLAAIRGKFPWLLDFDAQIYSCELGIAKPAAEIFEQALMLLKVRPEETLFIDDKERNLTGAAKLGMRTMLYQYPDSQSELKRLAATVQNRDG